MPLAVNRRELRADGRVDIDIKIDLGSDHNFYTGLTQNISTGGVFVATNQIRPVGTKLMVQFSLPGSAQPTEVMTEVRWLRQRSILQADSGVQGMGLRFLDLPDAAAVAVTAFAHKRESLFYDDE